MCATSENYVKALHGSFKEAENRMLRLPGCNQETFEHFLYWACNNNLPNFEAEVDAEIDAATNDEEKVTAAVTARGYQLRLAKLWTFGNAYVLPKLQNVATRALGSIFPFSKTAPEAIRHAFAKSAEDSVLRKAFARETASDCLCKRFLAEEMEIIGAIPGVFAAIMDVVVKCQRVHPAKYAHTPECSRSGRGDCGGFLVPEEGDE